MAGGSILVVDDERRQREIYRDILQDEGYEIETAPSGEAALKLLAQRRFDLVITDLNLTGMTGVQLLSEIVAADPTVAVVLITGYPSIQSAIEATKKGVYQYLEKPVDRDRLLAVVGEVFQHLATLKQTILGSSPTTKAMVRMILKVAPASHTVLILGESGTGKELVARQIHNHSPRHANPFLAVNCAAITETLLESELFGHEKGAFTDAHESRAGKFELASGGTLLLDEIGDMSLSGQAKLLRVLEEKTIVRVGGSRPIHTDVRVLAATNQKLVELVRTKRFREDLYFRLNVVTLELPPLRNRGDDVMLLAEHFLREFSKRAGRRVPKFSAAARKRLESHTWPGNVRELRNLMERLAYLSSGERIEAEDLAFILSPAATSPGIIGAGLNLNDATHE